MTKSPLNLKLCAIWNVEMTRRSICRPGRRHAGILSELGIGAARTCGDRWLLAGCQTARQSFASGSASQ
jgi:hypothetical protein